MIKKLTLAALSLSLLCSSSYVEAGAAWYVGQVKRVALLSSDGSFIVTFKNEALDNCKYKYGYFMGSELGEKRLNNAYAMALTSIASGMDMGIVIDKAKNGDGGLCHAYGMTADLRAK